MSVALAAAVLAVTTGAVAARTVNSCFVKNGGSEYGPGAGSVLQTAINSASSGQTLTIRGRCSGSFAIQAPITLKLFGVPWGRYRTATIDAGGGPTALSINGEWAGGSLAADVTITNLLITGATYAAVDNFHGVVRLNGAASVSGNSGTGILQSTGNLTMNNSSTVSGNTDTMIGGGGIHTFRGTVTLNDEASVTGNVTTASGGGILLDSGSLRLAGSSSVTGNTAALDGGGIGFAFSGSGSSVVACSTWTGAISPNAPDDQPTPIVETC